MHPQKVVRGNVKRLVDLPNVGPASARDLERLGYTRPEQLSGVDPLGLYHALCAHTGSRQDPCVLDVFLSVADFLAGNPPQAWWHYTRLRKQKYARALRMGRTGA